MSDIEVKVTNLENIYVIAFFKMSEAKRDSDELRCPATALI